MPCEDRKNFVKPSIMTCHVSPFPFQGNPRLNLAFLANLFHARPGLELPVNDMDAVRLTEELNTALSRYCRPTT